MIIVGFESFTQIRGSDGLDLRFCCWLKGFSLKRKNFSLHSVLIKTLWKLNIRGHPMASLKEMFDAWWQEVSELFNSLLTSAGITPENQALLNKTETHLQVKLKIIVYKKEKKNNGFTNERCWLKNWTRNTYYKPHEWFGLFCWITRKVCQNFYIGSIKGELREMKKRTLREESMRRQMLELFWGF